MIGTVLEIVYSTRRPLARQRREGPCAADHVIEIVGAVRETGAGPDASVLGRLYARRIELSRAAAHGADALFELVESERTIFECVRALHDPATLLSAGAPESATHDDLLIVDLVELTPRYRGRGYGHLAVRETTRVWGSGCRFVCIDSAPILPVADGASDAAQDADREGPTNPAARGCGGDSDSAACQPKPGRSAARRPPVRMAATEAWAVRRLQAHWAGIGFRPLDGTPYSVLDLRAARSAGHAAPSGTGRPGVRGSVVRFPRRD